MVTDLSLLQLTGVLEEVWKCCDRRDTSKLSLLEGHDFRQRLDAWGVANIPEGIAVS
jgi:hypothetical protein